MLIINEDFEKRAEQVFNPRNVHYVSRNDGQFNNAINHQKDTLINATMMIDLGRQYMTPEEYAQIERIKSKWSM